MKICTDCKHHVIGYRGQVLCNAPQLDFRVSGEDARLYEQLYGVPMVIGIYTDYVRIEHQELCGMYGKWFEEKE